MAGAVHNQRGAASDIDVSQIFCLPRASKYLTYSFVFFLFISSVPLVNVGRKMLHFALFLLVLNHTNHELRR